MLSQTLKKNVLILKHFIFVFCLCGCMVWSCVCAGVCVCVCECVHVCTCVGQRSIPGVFLRSQICRFLRQGLSLEPGARRLGWLAGQWAPGIRLSLPPSTEIKSAHRPARLLRQALGNQCRSSSYLCSKCFTNWPIPSPQWSNCVRKSDTYSQFYTSPEV